MAVLITGASGFIGSKLLQRLPIENTYAVGRKSPELCLNNNFFEREINASTSYKGILDNVDTVIHLAARVHVMEDAAKDPLEAYREVNTYGTINLAKQAIKAGVKRFIFISSIKSNGESTKLEQPFKCDDPRAPEDFYGQSKSEAEEQLLQLAKKTALEIVIIRPTLVYGPGVKANFASLMSLVSKGIPLPFACIKNNKRSLVFVENLVDLIVTCIDHPKAANQVFLVSDGYDISTSEMVTEIAKALGKSSWQIPIPVWGFKLVGKLFNKSDVIGRLTGSLQVDIAHTKKILGWSPPQTLQDGFKKTAEAFLLSKVNGDN